MFKSHWIRALALAIVATGIPAVSGTSSAATTLTVGLNCYGLGHRQTQCEADVSGAVGSITYQWSPTPAAGGQALAIINCPNSFSPVNVSVTVTDSANGAQASDSGTFYCSPPQ